MNQQHLSTGKVMKHTDSHDLVVSILKNSNVVADAITIALCDRSIAVYTEVSVSGATQKPTWVTRPWWHGFTTSLGFIFLIIQL
jgi:hypothetical protein